MFHKIKKGGKFYIFNHLVLIDFFQLLLLRKLENSLALKLQIRYRSSTNQLTKERNRKIPAKRKNSKIQQLIKLLLRHHPHLHFHHVYGLWHCLALCNNKNPKTYSMSFFPFSFKGRLNFYTLFLCR
jgi:hypothetical protein